MPVRSADPMQVASLCEFIQEINYSASYTKIAVIASQNYIKLLLVLPKRRFEACLKTLKIDFRPLFAELESLGNIIESVKAYDPIF